MTEEEWYLAYILQFGPRAIYHGDFEGEDEFFLRMQKDLNLTLPIDCIILLQRADRKYNPPKMEEVTGAHTHHFDYRRLR